MTTITNTATIADQVRDFITDYVGLPDEAYADILALYTIHTHAFNVARTTPYIYITSQGPGSGKTRLMEVMLEVCKGSQMFAGGTGPTFFTLIEARKPTLFIDEVDTIYSGAKNEELRQVLNSGYKHNGSIPRVDKSSEDGIKDFSTFCPKVLGGIDNGQVPNTVIDRAITITMIKANPGQIKPFYSEDVEELAADLMDDIRTWVAANADALANRDNRPDAIPGLSDRQNDIIRPLLTIADRIPGWGKRARVAFLRAFTDAATPLTPQAQALSTVRDYMTAHDLERVTSARVMELTGVSGKQIGSWFTAFGVKSGTYSFGTVPTEALATSQDAGMHKGFIVANLTDAFARYLPALPDTI